MSDVRNSLPLLSIVVPCFNEEEIIEESIQKLLSILTQMSNKQQISANSYICCVDDGSHDTTWQLIQQEALKDGRVRGLKLSTNFGHQNALLAGLFHGKKRADCLLTIDADLQDDVSVIPLMIEKFLEGNQIVYGVRNNRESDFRMKRNTAQLYYKLLKFLKIKTIYNHADFRLASRKVIENLARFDEVNLFLRGIFPLMGFKHEVVHYSRLPRTGGGTKYPFRKMLSFAWEGVTSFNTSLLRLVTYAGAIMFLISVITGVWVLVTYLLGQTIKGWASLLLITTTFLGVNMISLGLIGEYVAKIYLEVKKRPRFIIEEEIEN